MAVKPNISITNNFTAGLKTEFTGLNFPENAATSVDNCVFTLIGDVLRREGIDYETNFTQSTVVLAGRSISSYKWNNVGGDGSTQIVVVQIGETLYFFQSSNATNAAPLSTTKLVSTVSLNTFHVIPNLNNPVIHECQYTDGNGYLFVFHPDCDPFYCTYTAGTITATPITVLIRDFEGVNSDSSGLYSSTRPVTLANDHQYNLQNQGWDLAKITTFNTAVSAYPSNSDVWWWFKNSTGAFSPSTTFQNVIASGPAPKGSFLIGAFDQVRGATGTPLPEIISNFRPKTGAWFQGRVWYVGADAPAVGAHTFSETIYFSQIIVTTDQFGFCYQTNDPTSEKLFDLLPTDGGTIKIQGCGAIYKLFPIQNGLLVFAANGIWFITGSQGIGFAANDYTVTKISSVQSISSTSFVNVLGFPMFWNEEGIYVVAPSQQGGGLVVENMAIGTILSYYAKIPSQSKRFVRGDYNPIDFVVQWTYRSTDEIPGNISTRYQFDRFLTFNTSNKAFYPYSISGQPNINGIIYVASPAGGSTNPEPTLKYLASKAVLNTSIPTDNYQFTFAEEHDGTHYVDWFHDDNIGTNFVSTFTTGYRVHGQGIGQWQPVYLYMYLRNDTVNGYKIQSVWDYAGTGDSGRFSSIQRIVNFAPNFTMLTRRHKLRGHGLAFQLKVSSVDGLPFDIMGWTAYEMVNVTP